MWTRWAVLAAVLGGIPAVVAAQGGPRMGGQISFARQENAGLGVRVEQPLTPPDMEDVRLLATFDYFFPDSPFNYWELNTDVAWSFRLADLPLDTYGGGGLNMVRQSLSGVPRSAVSELGINLLLGIRIPTASRFRPYVELRPELGGGNRLVLTTGIVF